jgi:trypsin-like peptidase
MNWNDVVAAVRPHVVKIETPEGHGTGFLCLYNEPRTLCGIATAYHVIARADEWQQPVRIKHYPSDQSALLAEADRVILVDSDTDSAVVLLPAGKLPLPDSPLGLIPITHRLPVGAEVAWLGYPGVEKELLCFFAGNISAWSDARRAYLIDGVSIHGISGGPVLYRSDSGPRIVGSISAYMVNRATGESLPGLAIAQDVWHFHATISALRSFDEAKAAQEATEDRSLRSRSDRQT